MRLLPAGTKDYLHTFRPERISYYEVIFHPRSGFHRAAGSISLKKEPEGSFYFKG